VVKIAYLKLQRHYDIYLKGIADR